jgi:hypothetical protein
MYASSFNTGSVYNSLNSHYLIPAETLIEYLKIAEMKIQSRRDRDWGLW